MLIFKRLLKISWNNIFRNRRRSALTLTIITFGCTGLILIGGYFFNILESFREQFIHSQTGHLQVHAQGFHEKGASDPFQYMITDVSGATRLVRENSHVQDVYPRLKFGGMVNGNNTNVAVMVLGTDPVGERKMGNLLADNAKFRATNITQGHDLDPQEPMGAVLGQGLLTALGLKLGDTFSFITSQKSGALEGAEFKVVGVFRTIMKDYDDRIMKINLETAQKILGAPGEANSLVVILDDTQNTESAKSQLAEGIRKGKLGLEIIPWTEHAQFYLQSKDMLERIFLTVQIIICIIFIFSVANTLNMSIFERVREFGTMMALGNHRATIFSVILLEACLLGLLGALLGVGVGSGLANLISAIGIEMPPPPSGSYGYFAKISLYPKLLIETFFIALFATTLSAIMPAYRACHFKIVQALGYV